MKILFFTKKTNYLSIGYILLGLFLSSCKKENNKDDSGNSYMITYEVGSIAKSFTEKDSPLGGFYNHDQQYGGIFTCSHNSNKITLLVLDNKAITATIYRGYNDEKVYLNGAAISLQEGSVAYRTESTANSDVKIEITKITETTIRGKFSGTLKSEGKPDRIITNGNFFVPRGPLPS